MKIAIALTLYRRPGYTQETLNALLDCYGIEGIPIFISHDWNREHNAACVEVARIAKEFQQRYPGPSQYFVHRERLGIDLNKLFVIPKAFESGADFVIFIEDDTVPARDLVRFMVQMAERYKNEKEIWSVCGYNNLSEAEFQTASIEEYGIRTGMNPWIWGCWEDRWKEFFGDDGESYKTATGNEANGLFDHFLSKKHRKFILPVIPRCRLIGEFNAEHTTESDWMKEKNPWGAWLGYVPDGIEYRPTEKPELLHAGTAHIEN